MKITGLSVRNYRTLQALDLSFAPNYSAICGKNDSGKTNVVKAIRCLFAPTQEIYRWYEEPEFLSPDDFTIWVTAEQKDRKIQTTLDLEIDIEQDSGLFFFLMDYLDLDNEKEIKKIGLSIELTHSLEGSPDICVKVFDKLFDGLKAQEVMNRIRTSQCFLFYNSVAQRPLRYSSQFRGLLGNISEDHNKKLEESQHKLDTLLSKIAKEQGQELESLLGRLQDKYQVGISIPPYNPSRFSFNLTLGDRNIDVDLDEWGSGTRNRTMVLLTIFRAKQIAESTISAEKVTPIIFVEEPESYLHPMAQAEFGRVLQDLSNEFEVQIIVTTHSPYLLSREHPTSNILLERKVSRGKLRETFVVDTSGENWMNPFSLALGINGEEFQPWRDILFSHETKLLLVEGVIDKQYFELLRDEKHGDKRLAFDGDVFAYGGRDALKNQALLRFLKDKFKHIYITFDSDSIDQLTKPLEALGFINKKNYQAIGIDKPGKRCIEGLLPERILQNVYTENPVIVQAMSGTTKERNSAKAKLKKLLFDSFKKNGSIDEGDYKHFYSVVKTINKAFTE